MVTPSSKSLRIRQPETVRRSGTVSAPSRSEQGFTSISSPAASRYTSRSSRRATPCAGSGTQEQPAFVRRISNRRPSAWHAVLHTVWPAPASTIRDCPSATPLS
ncbi:hypothetical protein [Azospirillum baldaniorum]|uniref:hypothetical protein n=1 Tax=Azospirillum baldaniorum TaxID=1064539 RepID=UPI00059FC2A3|nr:hypothetical protein [Azospirillum baldaniorum]